MRSATIGTLVLVLSAGLGSAHASAQATTNTITIAPPQLDPGLAAPRARRSAARYTHPFVGYGAVGMGLGATGVIGGVILAIAGATRGHTCSGFFGGLSCYDALPDDMGLIGAGVVSGIVGGLAIITGAVVLSERRPAVRVGAVALRDGVFLTVGGAL